jgi:hypothetical protein
MGKVLHASKSGYFTTCIIEGEPPPFSFGYNRAYISTTLREAMGLFWRVKTWEAKITGAQVVSGFGDSLTITPAEDFYRTLNQNPSLNFNKEEDLVCYAGEAFSFEGDFPIKRAYQNPPEEFDAVATMFFRFTFYEIRKAGDVYYPYLSIYLDGGGTFSNSVGDGPKAGGYTITAAGAGLSIANDLFFQFYPPEGFEYAGGLSIQIRAKEYWSYGGTYNTATGEPL